MDIELPNGTVIQGVPDGTTKAQLAEKLTAKGMDVPKEWMSNSHTDMKSELRKANSENTQEGYEKAKKIMLEMNKGTPVTNANEIPKDETPQNAPKNDDTQTTATGAFARGAARSATPTAAAVAAFTPGFAAGSQLGQQFGPYSRIASPVLGVGGGIAASMAAGYAASKTQDKITEMVPESLKERLGFGNKVAAADHKQHPLASFAGEVAPQAAFMRPGAVGALPAVTGGVLGAGGEGVREAVSGEHLSPEKIAMAGIAGATLQKPTALGRAVGLKTAVRTKEGDADPQLTAEQKAKDAGIDWSKLSLALRKKMSEMAKDSTTFQKITPEEIKTMAKMDNLPVKVEPTKGQLSRDPVQLRTEKNLAQTDAGAPLRERYADQNEQLAANLDHLKGKTRATAKNESDVGRAVVDKALRVKEAKSESKINNLYNEAKKAGETEAPVSTWPILDHVLNHDDPAMVSYVVNRLKSLKAVTEDSFGNLQPTRDLTLNEIEGIRRAAGARSKNGGTEAHYAGEVKKVLDKMTEGEGGEKYKAARAARLAHGKEFEDQNAVAQIIEQKTRTDRKTAVEDVFSKTVLNGSIEDLRKVKKSLLTGGDAETRTAGRQALRELRGQAITHLKESATNGVASDERRNPEFSAAGLKRAMDKLGDEKIEELFGKGTAKELNNILDVARDLKTHPPARMTGSDTAPNFLVMIDKVLGHIGMGGLARGTVKTVQKVKEVGSAGRKLDEALNPNKPIPPKTPIPVRQLSLGQAVLNQNKTREDRP